jgi:hypothetical protein
LPSLPPTFPYVSFILLSMLFSAMFYYYTRIFWGISSVITVKLNSFKYIFDFELMFFIRASSGLWFRASKLTSVSCVFSSCTTTLSVIF